MSGGNILVWQLRSFPHENIILAPAASPVMKGLNLKNTEPKLVLPLRPLGSKLPTVVRHPGRASDELPSSLIWFENKPKQERGGRVCAWPARTATRSACGGGVYLLQRATAESRFAAVVGSSDAAWQKESQDPAKPPRFTPRADEFMFSPWICHWVPSWSGVMLPPHQQGALLQSTFPYMMFPLLGIKILF